MVIDHNLFLYSEGNVSKVQEEICIVTSIADSYSDSLATGAVLFGFVI